MVLVYDFPGTELLERPRYFSGQLLTVDDMVAEQNYFREKMRRHNLFLHGWGSVCGLEVIAAQRDDKPWQVVINPGYAIGPYGDEIYNPKPVIFNLADCDTVDPDPCSPADLQPHSQIANSTVYVAIRYAERLIHPVKVASDGCGCDEDACEYIRVREGFQIECLRELPRSHKRTYPDMCALEAEKKIMACMDQVSEPWVVLAQVELLSPTNPVQQRNINNTGYRLKMYPAKMLQEQLIKCCCEQGLI